MSNAALLATAKKLISANGADVTFTRITTTGHDATLGTPTQTTSTTTVKAVLDASSQASKGETYQGDDTVATKKLWIAGLDMASAPLPGDTAVFDGCTWKVIAADKVQPDGTTYLYSIEVAR